jgi:hypothetical protein
MNYNDFFMQNYNDLSYRAYKAMSDSQSDLDFSEYRFL